MALKLGNTIGPHAAWQKQKRNTTQLKAGRAQGVIVKDDMLLDNSPRASTQDSPQKVLNKKHSGGCTPCGMARITLIEVQTSLWSRCALGRDGASTQ
eukprot:scaffold146644_cov24-Tisochrysis_lutea.AAC.1